ncbi:hypothetical protein HYS54_00895 [Candidatus Micrarchaeota archaeon]|nr:hypothetical protein [Candidatus Micrarchaeota archaeon]
MSSAMDHECGGRCVDIAKNQIIKALEKLQKPKGGRRQVDDLDFEEIPKLHAELSKHGESYIVQFFLIQAALNELVDEGKLVPGRKLRYFLTADTIKWPPRRTSASRRSA